MSRELDLQSRLFGNASAPPAPQTSTPSGRSAIWSDTYSVAQGSWHAENGAPFVYEPVREGRNFLPWFGASPGQPASTPASEALHSFFDGWINSLASWTQSGSATIGQHHDPFHDGFLASGSGSEPTHGGWGSSSR